MRNISTERHGIDGRLLDRIGSSGHRRIPLFVRAGILLYRQTVRWCVTICLYQMIDLRSSLDIQVCVLGFLHVMHP